MDMTDINEIKAGEYELVVVRWDERTSKPGEPFTFIRHRRGDLVQLSEADARRLVLAGAVVVPGTLERQAAEAARRQYLQLLAQMPDELRRELRAQDAAEAVLDLDEEEAGDSDPGVREELERLRAELDAARAELSAQADSVPSADTGPGTAPVSGPVKPPLAANKEPWVGYRKALAVAAGASPEALAKLEDPEVTKVQLQDDAFVARLLAS